VFISIEPLHLADVLYPAGHPRACEIGPVFAFLVRHRDGPVLVDTGLGASHPLIDRLYRPNRYSLSDALAGLGVPVADVRIVINTHLHFDHCGSNRLFPGTPIFVQATELEAARQEGYTVADFVDFRGAQYQQLHGGAEVASGVRVVPTPGHTRGHQSVVIDAEDGPVIIAGQAAETTAQFQRQQAETDEGVASLRSLRDLMPSRVYFSHDRAVWEQ
jgi:glyoxylase-like metal-dependent hydrolase (beta-lactamase superfamily II)